MTSLSRFFAVIVSILVGFAIFTTLYTLTKPAAPRMPSSNYQTLAEEYIDAIETFNHTGEIVVPEGAIFSYDGDTVIIKDHDSGAYVTCNFVLNGTVPTYNYTYYVSMMPAFFATLFGVLFALACYGAINTYSEGKKFRALNRIKSNATYGDDRRFSSNCSKCYKKVTCKCIQCPYATECGKCPSTDCMDAFEDMLQEHITHEDMSQYKFDDTLKEEIQFEDVPYKCDYEEHEETVEDASQECDFEEAEETAEDTSQECDFEESGETVEDTLQECDFDEHEETIENASQDDVDECSNCNKATSCECADCHFAWICKECPSENCNEEVKTVVQQVYGEVHTLDEAETAFQCTPDCSNFNKCECLHGCDYAIDCHKCPYPGCTHDIEMKLLGMDIPD